MFIRIAILVFYLGLLLPANSQSRIDSLQKAIRGGGHDNELMVAYTELAKEYYTNDPKTSRAMLDTALTIANKLQNEIGLADIYHVYGITYFFESDMKTALDYNLKALAIRKKRNDKDGLSRSYGNMALIYEVLGDMKSSLKYHTKSLVIAEELHDSTGIAQTMGNIGNLYYNVASYKQALDYQFKTLALLQKLKDDYEIATNYSNIANIYERLGDHKKANEYNQKSLVLHKKVKNKYGMALTYSNLALLNLDNYEKALAYATQSKKLYSEIGNKEGFARGLLITADVYYKCRKLDSAEATYTEALGLYTVVGDPDGQALSNIGLAQVYRERGQVQKTIQFAQNALDIVQGKGYLNTQIDALRFLYTSYRETGNNDKAYTFQEKYYVLKDSVSKNQGMVEIQRQELNREYEQRSLRDKLKREHEKEVEQAKADAKAKQQTIISVSLIGGIVIVAIFLIIVFNRLRVIRKQKKEIEEGHILLEEKNKEIVDSINYAWHIQHGMIPAPEKVKTVFPDSFVLYLPKDKLSGDFYWAANVYTQTNNPLNLFAVADCTGHGVPGALVSITGINYLKLGQQIPEVNSPAEALNFVNKGFYALFEENSGIRDGMDAVVGAYDKKTMLLQYSSAKNPIVIIRNNEIIELKGDKHPIGRFGPETPLPFTNHTCQIQKGDVMYVYSDGYVDQFGKSETKSGKFKSGNFKKLLVEIHTKPLDEQQKILHATILKWRGNLEQTDDITVFGVRF